MRGRRWNRERPTIAQLRNLADAPYVPDEQTEKIFSAHKAEAEKRHLASIENFDKSILTYSSAGLGLSLAFLKDFVPLWQASCRFLLYISWGLFVLATVLTIFSFLISGRVQERSIADAEKYYVQGDDSAFDKKYWQNIAIKCSNWVAGAAFVSALVLSSVFVAMNADVRKNPSPPISSSSEAFVVQIVCEAGNSAGARTGPVAPSNKKPIEASRKTPAKIAQEASPVDQVLCK